MFQEQARCFEQFQVRHPKGLDAFAGISLRAHALHSKCNKGLSGHQVTMMAMAHMALDDFYEVVFLATHGEGFAAQKLLRTMFERVVTLAYLTKHPERLDDYIDYSAVEYHKVMKAIEATWAGAFTATALSGAKAEADAIASRFVSSPCPKCGETRPAMSWAGPLDFHSMAGKAGLAHLIGPAYVVPLGHAHPKPISYMERFTTTPDGAYTSASRLSERNADLALSTAHLLALYVLANSNDFFCVGDNFDDLQRTYGDIWQRSPDGSPTGKVAETPTE